MKKTGLVNLWCCMDPESDFYGKVCFTDTEIYIEGMNGDNEIEYEDGSVIYRKVRRFTAEHAFIARGILDESGKLVKDEECQHHQVTREEVMTALFYALAAAGGGVSVTPHLMETFDPSNYDVETSRDPLSGIVRLSLVNKGGGRYVPEA